MHVSDEGIGGEGLTVVMNLWHRPTSRTASKSHCQIVCVIAALEEFRPHVRLLQTTAEDGTFSGYIRVGPPNLNPHPNSEPL